MNKSGKAIKTRKKLSSRKKLKLLGEPKAKTASVRDTPVKQRSAKTSAVAANSPARRNRSESGEEPQRGRPKAKRSDPDFICFTTYIRKRTHRNVKIRLLQEDVGRQLSALVEELLAKWLKQ